MPRITCPYCRVQYGHEWWCWFKRITYRRPKKVSWDTPPKPVPLADFEEIINLIRSTSYKRGEPTLTCNFCHKEVPLLVPYAPQHFWWCRFRRLLYWLTGE